MSYWNRRNVSLNEVLLLRNRDSLESNFCCHTGVKYNGMLRVLHTKIFDRKNKDAKRYYYKDGV